MKRVMKSEDGLYHINGSKFEMLVGSRAQVWHGTAYKTTGELTKSDLFQNKRGRIVSKKIYKSKKRKTFTKIWILHKKRKIWIC